MKIEVRGRIRIHPTEDIERVKETISRIVANPTLLVNNHGKFQELIFTASNVDAMSKMKTILAHDQIRDAARKVLLSSLSDDIFDFYLNKQVACAGHISFCQSIGESPLGPIHITIETDEPNAFVDWIAPSLGRRERYKNSS